MQTRNALTSKLFQVALFSFCRNTSLILVALLTANAHGAGWSFDNASSQWGNFALGLASGIAGHELGHYVVATTKGYTVGHDGLSIVYSGKTFSPSDHLQVASAGFQAQWLLTEFVLRDSNGREIKSPPGNFGAGIVCAHLAVTAAYLVSLKDHPQGDVAGMSQATGYSHDRIMMALAIPGALDAWRLFGNQVPEWAPQLSLLSKGLGMAWAWTY